MKYILLSPLVPSMFGMTNYDQIKEALEEFGCSTLESRDSFNNKVLFATANNQDAITNMTSVVQLPGIVLEYTSVYDQALVLG
jgi:hypothetical protein